MRAYLLERNPSPYRLGGYTDDELEQFYQASAPVEDITPITMAIEAIPPLALHPDNANMREEIKNNASQAVTSIWQNRPLTNEGRDSLLKILVYSFQ